MDDSSLDLYQDHLHLQALYSSLLSRVETFHAHVSLKTSEDVYLPSTRELLISQAVELEGRVQRTLEQLRTQDFSIQKKKEYSDLLRTLDSIAAGLFSSGNWQSPSFWHSQTPQAGSDAGHVSASSGDYKRDMHRDEKHYSEQFVKEYVDHPLRLAPFAYATSSGMSAITTALVHLQEQVGNDGVVLAGRSSYFQNKWQLEKLFPGKVQYVDEFDAEGVLTVAEKIQPAIVFLDSICGAESLPMPDLKKIIPGLSKILSRRSTLVLDNTGLGPMYQPLRDLPINPFGMRMVVVESLLKFHQFGFDRVSGGIIWTPSISESGLFTTRMHLGTMMPDASVLAVPEPNREMLDARLLRIGRNAKLLAAALDSIVSKENTMLEKAIHPSLPSYEGYSWTKDMPFQGAFVTLRFIQGKRSVSHYDAFVSRVAAEAKEAGVDIIGGTSFGFDTTRLYVTARYATDITEPFVRISVGTETTDQIEALACVFEKALA